MDKKLDRLKQYYAEIDSLSDEIPQQLTRKITLYSMVLLEVGKFHAEAVNAYGKAYANRKAKWGAIAVTTDGSGVMKEAAADEQTHELRLMESAADGEMHRWKNAFISHQEIINALKVTLKVLVKEMDNS